MFDPQSKLDVLRLLIGAMAGATFCMTVLVIVHYRRMIQRGHRGILPRHVLLASVTLILATFYVGFDAMSRVGLDYWTWRLPLGAGVFVCGIPTVVLILKHVQQRDAEMEAEGSYQ